MACATLLGHTKLISCFCSARHAGQFSLSYLTYVISIQHATTVFSLFTQPAFSGFTIQASARWIVLSPDLTLCDAFCCLYTQLSFNFGFRKKKKKKKPSGLVIFKWLVGRKTTSRGLSMYNAITEWTWADLHHSETLYEVLVTFRCLRIYYIALTV